MAVGGVLPGGGDGERRRWGFERLRGSVGSCWRRFRAAVSAAGGQEVCSGVGGGVAGVQPVAAGSVVSFANAALSASAHGQVRGGAACRAAGEREPGADVQQPVAQPFRFGFGELAFEHERLGPDDQIVGEHHDLQPHLVERERFERELRQAGVFVVADAVLDPGALAVTALEHGDVRVGLVGQDRLEAVSVVVGERQLRAGVRTLPANDQPEPSGQVQRSRRSVISATWPFSRSDPSWSSAAIQALSGVSRIAARTVSVSS